MVSAISSFVLIFALMVKSRETPTNYILLALFVSTTGRQTYAFDKICPRRQVQNNAQDLSRGLALRRKHFAIIGAAL